MKKILFLIPFLLVTFHFQAQVQFETSLAEAFKIAKKQNKLVFVEYYNSECSVCKKLSLLMETDSVVSKFYNQQFVNYKINTKGDENGKLKEDEQALMSRSSLNFDHVPVLLFFDFEGNFLHHSGVKVESDYIVNAGKTALHPDYRSSNNPKKYQDGDRSIRTLYAYCDYLVATQNDAMLKIVTNDLFDVFSKDSSNMTSISSYTVLKNVIISTENGFFVFWINNMDKLNGFEKGSLKDMEKLALEKILLKELRDPNIKNWSLDKKELHKKYILELKITNNPEVYFE